MRYVGHETVDDWTQKLRVETYDGKILEIIVQDVDHDIASNTADIKVVQLDKSGEPEASERYYF